MIYLLHGENKYESWIELSKLKKEFLKKQKDGEIEVYDDEDLIEKKLDISAYSFFNKPKLYVFKRFFSLTKIKQEKLFVDMENYDSNDIIIWEDKKTDKRGKIYKTIKKKFVEREFANLKGKELDRWILKKLEKEEIKNDRKIVEDLKNRFMDDQWMIENEILKLSSYLSVKGRKEIQDEDYDILSRTESMDVWKFCDLFFGKQKVRTLNFLETLRLERGEEIMLLGSLVSQLRLMFLLKESRMPNDLLASRLKVHPYRLRKISDYSSRFSLERLKKLYSQLSNIDFSIKQGKLEAKIGLGLLIASL